MKMHITIIPEDHFMSIDGMTMNFDFPAPENLHAIQWHNGRGEAEYKDESPNYIFDSSEYESILAPFVSAFEIEYQKREEERIAEEKRQEEEYNKPENVQERLRKEYTDYIQTILDDEAKKLGYDSCLSVCSYVSTGVAKFDAEGLAFREWRSAVWNKGYEILALVLSGEMEVPSYEELVAMLPKLEISYPA